MNLRRRILFGSLGTIAIMGMIALLSMFLLRAMQHSLLTVIEEYGELREIDEARSSLEDARLALTERPPHLDDARLALKEARAVLESFTSIQHLHAGAEEEHHTHESEVGTHLIATIDQLIATFPDPDATPPQVLIDPRPPIDELRLEVLTLAGTANQLVDEALHETQRNTDIAHITLVTLCLAGVFFVWTLAFLQYRWVLHPIVSLRNRVRDAVAARRQDHDASDTADPVGDLGRGFSGMLDELNDLYGTLESRVQQKSKELVMAERLASVGYLAAGVAHEINNPLNAIMGYTELTLRDLERIGDDKSESAAASLTVVRDEALRCKHIVEKLLSLVRNSDAPREVVELDHLVEDVLGIIHGLKQFRSHEIETRFDAPAAMLCVVAREAEIKQVLLNLVINAIEATPEGGGRVRVCVSPDEVNNTVNLEVADDGQGMDDATRQKVFEPFFTHKRGGNGSGTGLGLSVVHAIVQDHGGQITAYSDGLGHGSRFVVRLPVANHVNPEACAHG